MCPRPHDGTAEAGLSCALLQFVHAEHQIDQLRHGLSEFSHRCRNLLNGMKMGLYFLRKSEQRALPAWWVEVEEGYRSIELLFETLQRIYRPMPLTTIRASFGSLVRDRQRSWSDRIEAGGRSLHFLPPEEEQAGEFDPICLGMAIDAFVDWRSKAMAQDRHARIRWETTDGFFDVTWEERAGNDHGSPSSSRGASSSPGAFTTAELALPLLVRVLTAHAGVVHWTQQPDFQVHFRWPLRVPIASIVPAPMSSLAVGSRT